MTISLSATGNSIKNTTHLPFAQNHELLQTI